MHFHEEMSGNICCSVHLGGPFFIWSQNPKLSKNKVDTLKR